MLRADGGSTKRSQGSCVLASVLSLVGATGTTGDREMAIDVITQNRSMDPVVRRSASPASQAAFSDPTLKGSRTPIVLSYKPRTRRHGRALFVLFTLNRSSRYARQS